MRIRTKICDRCQKLSDILYRIQADNSGKWQFVCHACWEPLSQNNLNYLYGGTWKARKS